MHPEPLSNIGYVCKEHAPQPDPRLAKLPPTTFLGRYVKRAFLTDHPGVLEHMWVKITAVLEPDVLQGTLDNDPYYDVGHQCGDTVTIHLTEIAAVCD